MKDVNAADTKVPSNSTDFGQDNKLTEAITEAEIVGDFAGLGQVPWDVNKRKPGVFFQYNCAAEVHAALQHAGVLPYGLTPGSHPNQSLFNLRHW